MTFTSLVRVSCRLTDGCSFFSLHRKQIELLGVVWVALARVPDPVPVNKSVQLKQTEQENRQRRGKNKRVQLVLSHQRDWMLLKKEESWYKAQNIPSRCFGLRLDGTTNSWRATGENCTLVTHTPPLKNYNCVQTRPMPLAQQNIVSHCSCNGPQIAGTFTKIKFAPIKISDLPYIIPTTFLSRKPILRYHFISSPPLTQNNLGGWTPGMDPLTDSHPPRR